MAHFNDIIVFRKVYNKNKIILSLDYLRLYKIRRVGSTNETFDQEDRSSTERGV
jgi:hypothetical protein